MSSSAGKVLLMPKGEYNSAITYYIYDVVYYETNNSKGLYVAKQTTTGVAPTNTTNWQILIDLTNYISTLDIATQQELGVIKSDGMTTEVSITGVLKALGVGIVCTINPSGTEHGANWLKFGNDVITPDTRQMYRVNVDGKEFLFFWNGTQYIQLSGGGHTVTQNVNGSILPMAGRAYLQFDNVQVEDDPTNDSTVIKPQIQICATETEWNQMSDAQKNDPLVYWYLPWAPDNVYSQDKTPVGTVITVATGKTGDGITDVYTPTNPFPNEDYLICNGNLVQISEYPQLANHFEEVYGDKFYFTNGVDPGNGRFQLPNWETDYPENGIICIKARITSDVITFAEVDETGLSSETDKVPNCARVADIEGSKITIIKDISDLGISTGGLLADFVKAMPSKSYAQISVTANTTFTDVPRTGELYIFKPFGNEVIHKTMILEYVAAQSTTSFADAVAVGFIPYNGGVSANSKWFAPTLTAL